MRYDPDSVQRASFFLLHQVRLRSFGVLSFVSVLRGLVLIVVSAADRASFVDVGSEDSGSEFHGEPSDLDNPGHNAGGGFLLGFQSSWLMLPNVIVLTACYL